MARIDNLTPHQPVQLRFQKSGRDNFVVEDAFFLGIEGTGDDRHARFVSHDEHAGMYEWEAYRFNGSWAYGSSAQRLSLVSD